jgi:hypothetical protein
LSVAGIAPERCGDERTARLDEAERDLYQWILRRWAEVGRPSGADMQAKARELGLGPAAAARRLADEDLVHLDADGEISVAYPFSGRPTRHRVVLADGHDVYAMCAIDALGVGAMLEQAVDILSTDPTNGAPITVNVATDGRAEAQPPEAVVLAASACEGPSYESCCGVLNFFSSPAAAIEFLAANAHVSGRPISISDAAAAGTAIFGKALAGGSVNRR